MPPNPELDESGPDGETRYVTGIAVAAALGGLLFGYDTAVISGAIGFLEAHFDLTPAMKGWAASSALLGSMLGVVLAGWLSDRIGRKRTLITAAVLFLISAVGSALPRSLTQFVLFRFVGGVAVGTASITSPMYISEVAPSRIRGRLVSIYQFAIIFGMQVVYFVNYFVAGQGTPSWNEAVGWRWMFGSEAIPAVLFLGALSFVPETPRWLTKVGRGDEARSILDRLVGATQAKEQLEDIRRALAAEGRTSVRMLFERPGLRAALGLGVALAVLQQATGINVFLYYAPEIFKELGSGVDAALLQTVVVGAVNLTFTVIAMWKVDELGRRPLLMVGATGMGISLAALGIAAYTGSITVWILIFILGYIACFALSLGPVVWVVISEIFPNSVRGRAMGVASFFLWGTNFLVSQTFPMMNQNEWLVSTFNRAFPFWMYGLLCFVTVFVVWRYLPETKEKTLEEIEEIWGIEVGLEAD